MVTITTQELNDLFRWCDDIDMFATDRPINDTKDFEGSGVEFEVGSVIETKIIKVIK